MKSTMIICVVLLLATSALSAVVRTSVESCVDQLRAEVYILIDGSGSINSVGWGRAREFACNFTRSFPYGSNNVQFAVGTFSNEHIQVADLNDFSSSDQFCQVVRNLTQQKGETWLNLGLQGIREGGYLTSPDKGARPGTQRIVIVITDGDASDKAAANEQADLLRADGVSIIGIGIGSVNKSALREIAGSEANVFTVKNFAGLEAIKDQITQQVCEVQVCTERFQVDLFSLIDNSGSISTTGYGRTLNFETSLLRSLPLGPDKVQCGFSQFSNALDPRFEFDTSYDFDVLAQIVSSSRKTNGGTYTANAINQLIDEGHLTGHGRRNQYPLVVVIHTDGRSNNTAETIAAADRLHDELNAVVFVVTVGSVYDPEIIGIARDPRNVFSVKSLAALEAIRPRLIVRACEVSSVPVTTAAPTTTTAAPETTTPAPETTTPEPETTTPAPETTTPEPETTTPEPETTTPEPETTTPEPETTTPEPISTTDEPDTVVCITETPEPETTTPEPETTTPEPETTTPEPETTTPEPETTTPEPETTTPEPETTTPAPEIPVTPCTVEKPLDVVFVIDGSASIGAENFDNNRVLLKNIADGLISIGGNIYLSFIVYGTHAYTICGLTNDVQVIEQAIRNLPYRHSTTQTDAGIRRAVKILETEGQPGAVPIVVVITDGVSTNKTATYDEARNAKDKGIILISVGVGSDIDRGELRDISSSGSYLNPTDYDALPRYAGILAKQACDAAQPTLPAA